MLDTDQEREHLVGAGASAGVIAWRGPAERSVGPRHPPCGALFRPERPHGAPVKSHRERRRWCVALRQLRLARKFAERRALAVALSDPCVYSGGGRNATPLGCHSRGDVAARLDFGRRRTGHAEPRGDLSHVEIRRRQRAAVQRGVILV